MLFQTFSYLVFLPLVVATYWALPHKYRYLCLLAANAVFYLYIGPSYLLLLLFSTTVAYAAGLALGKAGLAEDKDLSKRKKKRIVLIAILILAGTLFFFKYVNKFLSGISLFASWMHMEQGSPVMKILLPVGLSFYTMTLIGYVVDVYRGTVKPERHFGYFALFSSFFPQLLAGPIVKAKKMIVQYKQPKQFSPEGAREAILIITLGLFKKIVIADRLALLSDEVFNHPGDYSGLTLVIGMVFYSLQLYCDFSAYSEIALGSAKLLGIDIIRNFDRPLLSTTTASFYRKWHISLTNWLNEYIFLPLSKKRVDKGTIYRNIMVVWLVSGVWHGAEWTFLVWGAMNGLYNIIGKETRPHRVKLYVFAGFREDSGFLRVVGMVSTFALISFSRIFFRSGTIGNAFAFIRNIFVPVSGGSGSGLIPAGFGALEFGVSLLMVALMITLEVIGQKRDLRKWFLEAPYLLRGAIYFTALFFMLFVGAYGNGYHSVNFIYFRF